MGVTNGIDNVHEPVSPFVDGAPAPSESCALLEVVNPSNGKLSFSIPAGCETDADRAVASARRAFDDGRWSDVPPSQRKAVLHRFAELIAAEAASLDVLDAGEMGKPVSVDRANAGAAAGLMRFHAEAIDKLTGDVFTSSRHSFVVQRRVPRGVVGAVVPWNFPTYNAVLKIAPALAGGNCVVLKPSELSSRSAMRLARLAMSAGLPAGVLNVVPGSGETVGRALGLHPDVDMVTFTGSTAVGKLILQYAGLSNMKVVMAECGGKSPHIVFDDGADLDAAADSIADALITNQGQICSVGSRLLVHRSLEAEMSRKIASRVEKVLMGDALDPTTTFGPIVSGDQCERVMKYIETARADGTRLVTGGRRAMPETGGFFVEPTVFRGVSPTDLIAREEIFGPVLAVIPFEDEEDAVRIANNTTYGLAAYVWTAELSRSMRLMKGIRSGVWINAATPAGEGAGHATCLEPVGASGLGPEGGMAGMECYVRRQLVWINHA
jgi:acyl-CoA reductase-like NAD-dependent aldehyde dehydrogenase